jgi:hypothetical protein
MVLVDAGSEHDLREARERLTVAYVGARDGVGEVLARALDKNYSPSLPSYVEGGKPRQQGLTGQALEDRLALLRMQFPDRIN